MDCAGNVPGINKEIRPIMEDYDGTQMVTSTVKK